MLQQSRVLRERSQLSLRNLVLLKKDIKHLYLKLFGFVIRSSKQLRNKVTTREYFCSLMKIIQGIKVTKQWQSREQMIWLL
jgi:hypothetical protein